uniref:Histidine protein methyltransferase 1 homolog n=1 Tax=Eptatretus burgeri TaxID=7764 RepID=A0A8C4N9G8_EPTBU
MAFCFNFPVELDPDPARVFSTTSVERFEKNGEREEVPEKKEAAAWEILWPSETMKLLAGLSTHCYHLPCGSHLHWVQSEGETKLGKETVVGSGRVDLCISSHKELEREDSKKEIDCEFRVEQNVHRTWDNLRSCGAKTKKEDSSAGIQVWDVIPGVYEGGMAVWEGTRDLLAFLSRPVGRACQLLYGCRLLDMGCGLGLLGSFGLLCGAQQVHFQEDTNRLRKKDKKSKIVNVKNIDSEEGTSCIGTAQPVDEISQARPPSTSLLSRCRFFAGDWSAMAQLLAGEYYDVVLSAETMYRFSEFPALLGLLHDHLCPGGLALLAGKAHYFGTGGGTTSLAEKAQHWGFKVHTRPVPLPCGLRRELNDIIMPMTYQARAAQRA